MPTPLLSIPVAADRAPDSIAAQYTTSPCWNGGQQCAFDFEMGTNLGPFSALHRLKGHINGTHCATAETPPPESIIPKRACSTAMKDTSRTDCKTRHEVESDPHRYASLYGDCLIAAASRHHCVWQEA